MLSEKDLEFIRYLKPVTFDGTLSDGFDKIELNNQRQNIKKGSPRSGEQVRSDTAKGLGFEHLLFNECYPIFSVAAPPVDNPDVELDYEDRQKDFWYGKQSVQVKTITKLHGTYVYITDSMVRSIMKSVDLNDFFIFGLAQIEGSRDEGDTVFTYEPAFVISSWALKYLIQASLSKPEGPTIDLCDMYKRPDHYQSLHFKLCEAEA